MNEQNNRQTEKLTDKAFSRLLILSLLAIFVLITCLCSATYAWFVKDVSSSDHQITSAKCELKVELSDGTTVLMETDCSEDKVQALEAGTYTVTLMLPADSASGYLVIKEGDVVYHTDYIERHADAEPHVLTFEMELTEAAELAFAPRWGIYSGECDVSDGGVLAITPTAAYSTDAE